MLFNRGIDTVNITALSNHKAGILSNYIRIVVIQLLSKHQTFVGLYRLKDENQADIENVMFYLYIIYI